MTLRQLLPLLLLLAMPARANQVDLNPAGSEVAIRFYGLGLLPIDGNFARFRGRLAYDPTDQTQCRVELTADTASLAMANASIRDEVVGPEFMDTARFPTLVFSGTCRGPTLEGDLTMHGITHPFALTLEWARDSITATGRLQRADWGMTARPLLGGSTVRIRVQTVLPPVINAGEPRR